VKRVPLGGKKCLQNDEIYAANQLRLHEVVESSVERTSGCTETTVDREFFGQTGIEQA